MPRKANLYAFSLQNSLRYIDPDGRNNTDILRLGWGAAQNIAVAYGPKATPVVVGILILAVVAAGADAITAPIPITMPVEPDTVTIELDPPAPVRGPGPPGAVVPVPTDDTSIRPTRRPSSDSLRKKWEKEHNKPWPKEPGDADKNQEISHKKPRADGGTDAVDNIEPKPRKEHREEHKRNGDFKRWGERRYKKDPPPQSNGVTPNGATAIDQRHF